jgi:hypothetical protein
VALRIEWVFAVCLVKYILHEGVAVIYRRNKISERPAWFYQPIDYRLVRTIRFSAVSLWAIASARVIHGLHL